MTDLPTPWDDLAHVFRALDRGTKRSKLRAASVVCPNDHIVVEVYRGTSGTLWGIAPTNVPNSGNSLSGKQWKAVNLNARNHDMPGKTQLVTGALWCRCPDKELMVFVEDVTDAVDAGKRRIRVDHARYDDEAMEILHESGGSVEYLLGNRVRVVP